jgi:hypothetical protein|tara:strand:+ start:573 stop:950 length:378 start_codon:yes stop_codon:yes gene_type:complete
MMAYLTRREKLADGTSLEKNFPDMSNTEVIETAETSNILVPPKKPEQERSLQEQIEFIKKVSPGMGPQGQLYIREQFLKRALKKGLITEEDFFEAVKPLFGETGEKITERIDQYENEVEKDATGK